MKTVAITSLLALLFISASASARPLEDVVIGPDYWLAHGGASDHYAITTYPGLLLPGHGFTGYYTTPQEAAAARHLNLLKTAFTPKSLALQSSRSESEATSFTFWMAPAK